MYSKLLLNGNVQFSSAIRNKGKKGDSMSNIGIEI